MKNFLSALSRIIVIGWFVMAIVLYFRALFHPKYALLTWVITIICILIIFNAPPQKCNICLDGGYIDGK
jgi:hypothetical protein